MNLSTRASLSDCARLVERNELAPIFDVRHVEVNIDAEQSLIAFRLPEFVLLRPHRCARSSKPERTGNPKAGRSVCGEAIQC